MALLHDRIREMRGRCGYTLSYVAEKLGVTEATAQRYETGKGIKTIPYDAIEVYANIFSCSPAYLMGWEDEPSDIYRFANVTPVETKSIPLLGAIACGEPIFKEEPFEVTIDVAKKLKCDFCLRCEGDSMIDARILDGDIVFIQKMDIVENGDIAAVVVNNDNEATLKKFYYYRDKNMLILRAANAKYDDMIFTDYDLDNIRVLGKAVGFFSNNVN